MDIAPFKDRRDRLLARIGAGVAVIPTAAEKIRNRDAHYPYRADSYFHYLSGFPEPEAVLVLIGGQECNAPRSILFCRDKDVDKEIWDGFRYGPEAARTQFGFDETFSVAELEKKLPELLADQPTLWYSLGHDAEWDARVTAALNSVRAQTRAGKRAPAAIHDVRVPLDEMRLIKDGQETALMKQAAAISADAHRRAMRCAAPGRHEYEIEAELLHEFRRRGSQAPAYGSIVAAGANACVLHYVSNDRQIQDGDLILIDAGCELDGYAADITRTFPANGRFSGPQRDIYQLVLAAQDAAVAAIRPGARFHHPHDAAVGVLAQGLLDLGLLAGTLDEVLTKETYKRFYMHRTSHWLGLDVHDVGEYKEGDDWRVLAPGMVLTVEPGCYIRPADDVPAAFWNIGVRIEDDALVGTDGCELITRGVPVAIDEIEALMRKD
ncbi:Xaa-Pro aminopeptidase [Denitratisoma sp. DHT3]|uniref:Xaa-Pro aminopeptidase n=1 Tax=Denitratisoma sp. DHT3 TaxID=1981880 RepID=UPI0011983C93|nr:Xaa-Pro aminopeptidase [Denitratisoma sp. DHT3]QDX81281.1 Xaa-Pro aminopeptidase [Denitratisoma sp. DHT3]